MFSSDVSGEIADLSGDVLQCRIVAALHLSLVEGVKAYSFKNVGGSALYVLA